jgi:hypothetical protein
LFVAKETPIHEDKEELDKIYDSIINLKEKVIGKGPQTYEKLLEMLTGKNADGTPVKTATKTSTTRDSAKGGEKVVEKESEGVVDDEEEKPKPKPVAKKAAAKVEPEPEAEVEEKTGDDDFDFNFDDDNK